ncbi:uncharacterized protein LOC118471705 isoform X1 [Amphiprion ocellaris]|uniref:uncharacterized protein LOC118471705 isoform X1 n=1 Tax=Amphiprion ocellaris TaxID=80972 RepID=UPI0024116E70|nr:uncharacterized protein LOC118471705 isoform X1 [Amphiprion ocellaris]
MEQDCIAGLYQSMGISAGAEFSIEDVSLLHRKVFHVPSNSNEAHSAMKKLCVFQIAGDDNSWSCVGENVLDVLLEMEKERERKEMLYWDLQLLNTGNLNTLHHMMDSLHQNTDPTSLKNAYNSDSGSLKMCMTEVDSLQMGRLLGEKEPCGRVTSVRRLRKAARQCWARLASEGVQSILPFPWQGQRLGGRGQAWGCISLSDVLLLAKVKYDVVIYLLCTEMLQEHHTESVWEMLLPWQQDKEVEKLEDLVEEALESVDMLRLAELPGAFRIYK